MQWVWDSIRRLQPKNTETIKWKSDSRGVYPRATVKEGGAVASGLLYFSDYNPGQTYKKNSIVRVRTGNFPLGVWIAVRDVPPNTGPVFPEPHDVNPAVQNYWEVLCLGVKQYTGCRGTTQVTVYVNMLEV